MAKILVTGGCGYIGSHTLIDLIEHGHEVLCLDNLSNSSEFALKGVEAITGVLVQNINVDLCDFQATNAVFAAHPDIDGVIHFAAFKAAGDSVYEPLNYYHNNIGAQVNLLRCMEEYGVNRLIFSSSCTVYGNQEVLPVTEQSAMQPAESPYGRTKQIGEWMIEEAAVANKDLQAILLRYFNPAGAHESALLGESASSRTNLVPVIVEAVAGRIPKIMVFGHDYDTRDGTCIRDYIHVVDLASAHTLAMERLLQTKNQKAVEVFNLGTGTGVSVLEATQAFERANHLPVPVELGPRRHGDVVAIYANMDRANTDLGWYPKYSIDDIMRTAWQWELAQNNILANIR